MNLFSFFIHLWIGSKVYDYKEDKTIAEKSSLNCFYRLYDNKINFLLIVNVSNSLNTIFMSYKHVFSIIESYCCGEKSKGNVVTKSGVSLGNL